MLERVMRTASKCLAKLVINVQAYVFVRLSLEELKRLEGRNYKCFSSSVHSIKRKQGSYSRRLN